MYESLNDDEKDQIIKLLIPAMQEMQPVLEEAVGTVLDPASLIVGMTMALKAGNYRDLISFLTDEQNREILLALREKVT